MEWETIPPHVYPQWVVRSLKNDDLRAAWEGGRLLLFSGKSYIYRVTPEIVTQGHWEIGRMERQLRRRLRQRRSPMMVVAATAAITAVLVGVAALALVDAQGSTQTTAADMPAAASEPTVTRTPLPFIAALAEDEYARWKAYMLDLINTERAKAGAGPVVMGGNAAAQIHAENALQHCFGSHWGVDGLKPYMRYSLAGGYQSNAENALGLDYCITDADGYTSLRSIHQSVDDAIENWLGSPGHRDNMLDPMHRKVNIGIAWDRYNFKAVQQFEGDYITFTVLPAIEDGILSFSGEVKNGAELLAPEDLSVQVYYDPPHKTLTLGQLSRTYCYSRGQHVVSLRKRLPDGSSWPSDTSAGTYSPCPEPYDFPPTVPAARSSAEAERLWEIAKHRSQSKPVRSITVQWVTADRFAVQGDTFTVEANVGLALRLHGPGVYTVMLWARIDGERAVVGECSIFHETEPPDTYTAST